jgi:hypothetical protein
MIRIMPHQKRLTENMNIMTDYVSIMLLVNMFGKTFKIEKEQSCGQGVRRIKAVLGDAIV